MRSAKSGFGFGAGMAIGLALTLALIATVGYYSLRETVLVSARPDLDARARSLALPELKRYGIVALSDDAGLVEDRGLKALVGTGRDTGGKLKPLMVHFRVAQFGSDRQWKIESINIDG